jgi:hypothetical protein
MDVDVGEGLPRDPQDREASFLVQLRLVGRGLDVYIGRLVVGERDDLSGSDIAVVLDGYLEPFRCFFVPPFVTGCCLGFGFLDKRLPPPIVSVGTLMWTVRDSLDKGLTDVLGDPIRKNAISSGITADVGTTSSSSRITTDRPM